jgi:hypothetical protein
MRNIAIGHGTGAREVGRYRAGGARRTDLVVALTGVVVVAAAGVVVGVVVGIPGMDAHPGRRCRVAVARLTDGDDEAGGKSVRLHYSDRAGNTLLTPHDETRRIAVLFTSAQLAPLRRLSAYCVQALMNG